MMMIYYKIKMCYLAFILAKKTKQNKKNFTARSPD